MPGVIDAVRICRQDLQRIDGGLERSTGSSKFFRRQGAQRSLRPGQGLGEGFPGIGGIACIGPVLVCLIQDAQCAAIQVKLLDQRCVAGQDSAADFHRVACWCGRIGGAILRPVNDDWPNRIVHGGLGILSAACGHGPVQLSIELLPAHTVVIGHQSCQMAVAVITQTSSGIVFVQDPIGHEGALYLLKIELIVVGHSAGFCVLQPGAQKEKAVSGKNGIHLFT